LNWKKEKRKNKMEILPNIEIKDLCLYMKKEKILVIPDMHIGYEEALNKQGVLVPRFQFSQTVDRLKKILNNLEINKIIIIGDLKHEFGVISETEWRHALRILDLLLEKCNDIVMLKGNHDKILGPIAKKRDIKITDTFFVDNTLFCHGHIIPKNTEIKKAKTIIIGHEHPAVGIAKMGRVETYKCFLKGKFEKKNLIVMPSFNLLTEGSDVLREKLLSPFLKNIENFEVFVVSDKIYDFGTVRNLKKL
jgi:putative SbcD/Mre11-related phosphoesterase